MRSSNIELLRMVAMLAIVAHHYVVNSTVCYDTVYSVLKYIRCQLLANIGVLIVTA